MDLNASLKVKTMKKRADPEGVSGMAAMGFSTG